MPPEIVIPAEILESFSPRGRLAIDAALSGADAVLRIGEERHATSKEIGDHNYVTEGDKASEDAVIARIREQFPNDAILSEESYATLENPTEIPHLWLIDPIDGTFNYSKGIPYCGVSVGYAENGVIKAGAIVNPFTGDVFFAEERKGAYKNGKKIQVSAKADLNGAIVETDVSSDRSRRQLNMRILAGLNLHAHIRGSLVINAARVAAGEADLYYITGFGGPWDLAASISIVQEAGGVIYDFEGNDLTNQKGSFQANTFVVGNKQIVSAFTSAAREFLAE